MAGEVGINDNDVYSCGVCLDDMTEQKPRMLACHHSYCESCLKTLLHDGRIKCPNCRQITSVDQSDVTQLAMNFWLLQMYEREKSFMSVNTDCPAEEKDETACIPIIAQKIEIDLGNVEVSEDLEVGHCNPDATDVSRVVALPNGGAVISCESATNPKVLKINQDGMTESEYKCQQLVRGLIIDGNFIFVLEIDGKMSKVSLENLSLIMSKKVEVGEMGRGDLIKGNHFVISDRKRGEIFSLIWPSCEKITRLQGLRGPAVKFIPEENKYFVTELTGHTVKIYDKDWHLISKVGSEGEFNHPCCSIPAPGGSIIVADHLNSRVALFGGGGAFIRDLVAKVDDHGEPVSVSITDMYLWVAFARFTGATYELKRFYLH